MLNLEIMTHCREYVTISLILLSDSWIVLENDLKQYNIKTIGLLVTVTKDYTVRSNLELAQSLQIPHL